MRILHIAHYDRFPRTNETFISQCKNGLERFLESIIANDFQNDHFVLFFNHYDRSISVEQIISSGEATVYASFQNVEFSEASLAEVFHKLLQMIPFSLIHIHYLQKHTKIIPSLLKRYQIPLLATIHDESFLGENFGKNNEYKYDAAVESFFSPLKKIIFPHEIIKDRYEKFYNISNKSALIPLGVDLQHIAVPNNEDQYKILIMGTLNKAKGREVVTDLLSRNLPQVSFYHIGDETIEGLIHYNYVSKDIEALVGEISPDIILIPSVVEEAASYTSLEATKMGYPLLTFKVGAFNNLELEGRGITVLNENTNALSDVILKLSSEKYQNHQEYSTRFKKVSTVKISSVRAMLKSYTELYSEFAINTEKIAHDLLYNHNLNNYKNREAILFQKEKELNDYKQHIERNNQQQIEALQQLEMLQQKEDSRSMMKRIKLAITKRGGMKNTIMKSGKALKRDGLCGTYYRFQNKERYDIYLYEKWLKRHETHYTKQQVEVILEEMTYKPLISFLIPVYNVDEIYLRACIDSIRSQHYPHWELCLADDMSTKPHVRTVLEEYMQLDSRIQVVFRTENGHISQATNSALEIAQGEFIALVDNDDTIKENALLEVVKKMNEVDKVDMIYTDEDKIDASGRHRLSPFFKPDWSPDAFWCHMYLCHMGVYRTEIAREIGGFRVGYEGAQDYDFALRFTEQTNNIYHIPQILYHWRMIATSTAASSDNKGYAYKASLKAKQSAIERRHLNAIVEVEENQLSTNVYFKPEKTDFISIIIPTRDHGEDVLKCVTSIYEKSTWRNFEIILADNDSSEQKSLEVFKQLAYTHTNFKIISVPGEFNYSKINNVAVQNAQGNLLLFLNNDTEVITPDWLERLAGHAKLPTNGAVGARLQYANNHVQHAGIISLNQSPVHAFHSFHFNELGYFGRLSLTYNYLAVTGACLMVEKLKFNAVGGFDEVEFPIAYNDVDFCLKLYDNGYFNVVRGDVDLFHYESLSRGLDEDQDNPEKFARMEREKAVLNKRWGRKYLQNDPFYNPNLTQEKVDFTLK